MTPEDLVEIELIKQVKYKYMRCVDQKLWDEIAECFTQTATAAYSGGKYAYEGRDAIIAFLRKGMDSETFHSSHRVHHPEIELLAAERARGVWALEDTVVDTQWDIIIRGAAFYTDDYVKRDGRWLIQHTGYRRSYEEMHSRKDIPSLRLTASWWTTDGRSEIDA